MGLVADSWRRWRNVRRLMGISVIHQALTHFQGSYYLQRNPDVVESGMDPLEHLVRFGINEGRDPGPCALEVAPIEDEPSEPVAVMEPDQYQSSGVGEAEWHEDNHQEHAVLVSIDPTQRTVHFAATVLSQFPAIGIAPIVLTEGESARSLWASGFETTNEVSEDLSGTRITVLDVKGLDLAAWIQVNWASVVCLIAMDDMAVGWCRLLAPSLPNVGAIIVLRNQASEEPLNPMGDCEVHEWVNHTWMRSRLNLPSGVERSSSASIASRLLAIGRGKPTRSLDRVLAAELAEPRFSRRDLVVFPIIDWHFRQARPQHLARGFGVRGHRVFYLGVKTFRSTEAMVLFQDSPCDNVMLCAIEGPGDPLAVHHRDPTPLQVASTTAAIRGFLERHGVIDPIYLIQHPFWQSVVSHLPRGTMIYDVADRLEDLQLERWPFSSKHGWLVAHADHVTVTSGAIHNDLSGDRSGSLAVVRNAATEEVLALTRAPRTPESPKVVGYLGSLSFWFDGELLLDAARLLPQVQFRVFGAVEGRWIGAEIPANVQLEGEVPYSDVPKRLAEIDAGLIPFVGGRLVEATNPVKAYEYLAAGLPIVSTPMPEMSHFPSSDVWIATTAGEFAARIQDALKDAGDPGAIARRREWAGHHTWAARVRQVEEVLSAPECGLSGDGESLGFAEGQQEDVPSANCTKRRFR